MNKDCQKKEKREKTKPVGEFKNAFIDNKYGIEIHMP